MRGLAQHAAAEARAAAARPAVHTGTPTVSARSGAAPSREASCVTRRHDVVCHGRRAAGAPGSEEPVRPKPRKPASAPKKRGPKPTTSGDAMQLLDPEILEEFKATAAAEEAARQAAPVEPESDPARFNFHRILMNAASRGLPDQAEAVVAQLEEAGLPPGPRAYHALAFSYVRAKMPYDALDVAQRAITAGLQVLPETFVVLIFSLLNHPDQPDVVAAQQVLESMEAQEAAAPSAAPSGGPAAPRAAQSGWLMLCKELFRKNLIAEAMTSVKRGYDAKGYVSDPELAAFVIEQLAKAGLKDRAYQEVDALEALGYRPGPQHYNPLIKAEAAQGAWRKARYLLLDAFQKPTWSPPSVDSFNALLEGMVLSVDPASGLPSGPGVTSDVGGRIEDIEQPSFWTAEGLQQQQEGDAPAAARATRALGEQFSKTRAEMLTYGLRPDARCYAAMCAGYIKMRAADEALGSFQGMCEAGGTTRLLSSKRLTALLVMLAEEDRPADLLNVLKSMVSFNHPLPKAARAALDHVTPGATLTTAWLPGHFEHMRAHPDDGTGRGAGSSALASMRSLLQQAVETEEVDGVLLSKLGGCAVVDDGSGVWVKPSRMSQPQLKAELAHAGITWPETAKRMALAKLVKARREELPRSIRDVQAHLEAARKAEEEAIERKTGISLDESKASKKKGKVERRMFRVFEVVNGDVARVQNISQEVNKRRGTGFTLERGGRDPYASEDAMGGGEEGRAQEDELADIIKDGVDEGVGDILRGEDDTFGESGDGAGPEGALTAAQQQQQEDANALEITIDHIEARVLNRTAGMRVAYEVLRCVEMLGGQPSGPDYEALVAGAVAESNADVALELSERLPRLLQLGYSRDAVRELYEQLARVCLSMLRGGSADLVLERAEDLGLEADPALYAMLERALGGRPRHRDLAAEEMQELTEDGAMAELLLAKEDDTDGGPVDGVAEDGDEEEAEEEEEGAAAAEGGALALPAPKDQAAATGGAKVGAQAAEEDEEEDEEDLGVYGRAPAQRPAAAGEGQDAEAPPAWEAKATQQDDSGISMAPSSVLQLARLDDPVLDLEELEELGALAASAMGLEEASDAALAGPDEEQGLAALPEGAAEDADEGELAEEEDEEDEVEEVVLDDGRRVTSAQLVAIAEALQRGASHSEALEAAGLLTAEQAAGLREALLDVAGSAAVGEAAEEEQEEEAGEWSLEQEAALVRALKPALPLEDEDDKDEAAALLEDDEFDLELLKDMEELLGPDMERLAAAQARLAELAQLQGQQEAERGAPGGTPAEEEAIGVMAELQKTVLESSWRFAERAEGTRVRAVEAAQLQLEAQLRDDEAYRQVPRQSMLRWLQRNGVPRTEQVMAFVDSRPTLRDLAEVPPGAPAREDGTPAQPLIAQFLEQLAQEPDTDSLMSTLVAMEQDLYVSAGIMREEDADDAGEEDEEEEPNGGGPPSGPAPSSGSSRSPSRGRSAAR